MAPSTADSWHQVVEEKFRELQSRQCHVPQNIDREASFRSDFESLCKNRLEFNYTKLLARLSYTHISAFARAVDTVFKHGHPYTLAALVFGGCWVAIHVRCPKSNRNQPTCYADAELERLRSTNSPGGPYRTARPSQQSRSLSCHRCAPVSVRCGGSGTVARGFQHLH